MKEVELVTSGSSTCEFSSIRLTQKAIEVLSGDSSLEIEFTTKTEGKLFVGEHCFDFKRSEGAGDICEVFAASSDGSVMENVGSVYSRFTLLGDLGHIGKHLHSLKMKSSELKEAKQTSLLTVRDVPFALSKVNEVVPAIAVSSFRRESIPPPTVGTKWLLLRSVPFSIASSEVIDFFGGLSIASLYSRNHSISREKVSTHDVYIEFASEDSCGVAFLRNQEQIGHATLNMKPVGAIETTWMKATSVPWSGCTSTLVRLAADLLPDCTSCDMESLLQRWRMYSPYLLVDSSNENNEHRPKKKKKTVSYDLKISCNQPISYFGISQRVLPHNFEQSSDFTEIQNILTRLERAHSVISLILLDPIEDMETTMAMKEILYLIQRSRQVYTSLANVVLRVAAIGEAT